MWTSMGGQCVDSITSTCYYTNVEDSNVILHPCFRSYQARTPYLCHIDHLIQTVHVLFKLLCVHLLIIHCILIFVFFVV